MIDIKELRVGSYVYINDRILRVEVSDLVELNSAVRYGREADFLRPVRLSESILKRAGFNKETEKLLTSLYSNGEVYLKEDSNKYSIYDINSGNSFGVSVSYLHQLQNILSSMFNTELSFE